MVDSLAMFFGAKKRRTVKRSPTRKVKKSVGTIVVKGRERKLFKGPNGGLYYRTKSGPTYVDAKFVRKHSPKRAVRRASPKRRVRRASPKRRVRRASPKRRVRRASPKRRVRRASPKRRVRRVRYGIGLGQPDLLNMMGPAGLTVIPQTRNM
jgi:adenylate kinase